MTGQVAGPVVLCCKEQSISQTEQKHPIGPMELVKNQAAELKKLWKNKRQLTFQALNLAMIVFSALMIWKGLMVVTKSESPVVVVLR